VSEQIILRFFGGAELSLYFKKTKTITQHLSYDNMMKLTLLTMKVVTATKKKQVSDTGNQNFIVSYCFCWLREFFLCRHPFFTIFLTSNIVATRASTA
jgi:hypothetical protein